MLHIFIHRVFAPVHIEEEKSDTSGQHSLGRILPDRAGIASRPLLARSVHKILLNLFPFPVSINMNKDFVPIELKNSS